MDATGNRLLKLVTDHFGLSARSYNRILKATWRQAKRCASSTCPRRSSTAVWTRRTASVPRG
ncbi:MAG TPA: hypothetical protein VIU41_13400 [Geobacteraceae bacterium]